MNLDRLFLVFILFGCFQLGFSQRREAQIWRYGSSNASELDFGFNPIKRKKVSSSYVGGVASICDSIGKFLFSGNSGLLNIRDSVMPNGDLQPRLGLSLFSCYLIIPYQSDKKKYHYFLISNTRNTTNSSPPYFIYDLTIDMSLDGGLGDVDTTKTQIIDSLVDLQISCMLHANGRDSWLIGRGYQSDSLFAYQVTDSGVVKKVITDIISPVKKANLDYGSVIGSRWDSQLKSSPDSRMLFIPRRMNEFSYSELLQFDRETGVFSNRIVIPDTTGNFFITNYGDGAFSPDSKKLYYSIGTKTSSSTSGEGPGHFWQYEISTYDSAAIVQSKIFLGRLGRKDPNVAEMRPWAPKMQLAMDGKIYISPGIRTDKYMSTIRCPDKTGADCGLEFRTIDLGDGKNGAYFPTLNQTFVRNAGIFQVQANKRKLCQGDTLEMSGYGAGAEHFKWSVSPALPVSVKVDTLTWQKIPTQTIPPGSYTFTCQAFSRCGDVFEKSMVVTINANPSPSQPPQRGGVNTPCVGDSVFVFVANPKAGYRYFWNTGQIADTIVVKQSGKYALDSVANGFGCGIKTADTVVVVIKDAIIPPIPVMASPPLVEICQGASAQLSILHSQFSIQHKWSNGQVGDSVLVGGGQYSVVSISDSGCQSAPSQVVTVIELPLPRPIFVNIDTNLTRETLENQNYCVAGQPGSRFSFSVKNGTIVDSSEDCITVNWAVPQLSIIHYQLSIRETLQSPPCSGTASQTLSYRPKLEIPTLITPNNDGKNDAFEIQDLSFYPNHKLQIFNRWGKKVLETTQYRNNWKGDAGIYFYQLTIDGKDNKGWVQVAK